MWAPHTVGRDCPILAQLLWKPFPSPKPTTERVLQAEPTGVELPVQRDELAQWTDSDPMVRFTKAAAQERLPPPNLRENATLYSGSRDVIPVGGRQIPIGRTWGPATPLVVSSPRPPLAGHLGPKKMLSHMLSRFYWPGIYVH